MRQYLADVLSGWPERETPSLRAMMEIDFPSTTAFAIVSCVRARHFPAPRGRPRSQRAETSRIGRNGGDEKFACPPFILPIGYPRGPQKRVHPKIALRAELFAGPRGTMPRFADLADGAGGGYPSFMKLVLAGDKSLLRTLVKAGPALFVLLAMFVPLQA